MHMIVHVCIQEFLFISMIYFKEGQERLFPSLRIDLSPNQGIFYLIY